MAQDRIPVPRRLLVLPGGAGTGDAVPAAGPAPVPDPAVAGTAPSTDRAVLAASGVPMTVPERARLAVRSAAAVWEPYVGFARMLLTAKPASMAEHRAHIKSRAWVPPELNGKAATVIAWAGILHHLLINRPVKAAALMVGAAADKTLRLYALAATVVVLFILLSHYL